MEEYSVEANTVSNWVRAGLRPSDDRKPYRFRGAAVQEFHRCNRLKTKSKFRTGEFQCRVCHITVFPPIETFSDYIASNGKHMFASECSRCSNKVQKISSKTERDMVADCRNPNTPTDCLHEENTSICGGIGTYAEKNAPVLHVANDRIIFEWQTYAGSQSEKTIEKHLAAIRFFECKLEGKPFAKLSNADFATVRDELKRRATTQEPDRMSASTIRHIVSHLVAFFNWLLKQDGYRRLPRDFAGYLKLPKAIVAQSAQVKQKEFPSLAEAEELLNAMPSKSLVDMRARAIFALAFLGALRADTLVSLLVKHFDVERRLIIQDAAVVRAKAGKSLNIFWFPISAAFETVVIEWLDRLKCLGFSADDALFPDTTYLKHRVFGQGRKAAPVPVMSTTYAVTDAFSVACRNSGTKYTPHAAKHTIGAERDIRPLTHEERKAWSLNMGHESEQTTERHYGTMPDNRRIEVLENIGIKKTIDPRSFSDGDKAKFFDGILELIGNDNW
jgi:integrase